MLAFAIALAVGQASAAVDPAGLVGKTVPETHSVVVCPSAEAAGRMLDDHYRPGPHILETERFFDGLAQTGCTQDGGPVTVVRVDQSRTFDFAGGAQTHIRFEGRNASGATIHGIVDTDAFRVRTAAEQFLLEFGSDGQVELQTGSLRCPTPAAARAVVEGVPENGSAAERETRFDALVRAQNCTPVTGVFPITDAFGWVGLEGSDGAYSYHALAAAEDGREIGLLFSFAP